MKKALEKAALTMDIAMEMQKLLSLSAIPLVIIIYFFVIVFCSLP